MSAISVHDSVLKLQTRSSCTCVDTHQCSTYLAWLFCGWSGLHHLLLGRDTHALLWLTTFDGFGFGLLRDLWRIPSYVDDYNAAPYHMAVLRAQAQRGGRPWSVMRLVGQYIVGISLLHP